jgi:hypothetical protein
MRREQTVPTGVASSGLFRRGRVLLSRWVRPALDPREPTGLLTTEHLRILRALTETVAAGAAMTDADWLPVQAALVFAARERPGFRALCVRACRVVAGLAGGFAEASLAERTACIAANRLAVRPVPASELLRLDRRVHHEIRELLVPELIRAYFDGPAGWAVVGYDAVLGQSRDPFAYTRRPE